MKKQETLTKNEIQDIIVQLRTAINKNMRDMDDKIKGIISTIKCERSRRVQRRDRSYNLIYRTEQALKNSQGHQGEDERIILAKKDVSELLRMAQIHYDFTTTYDL
jgi:hypothetical protein